MAFPPEIEQLGAQVRNWGRWGDEDEIGTLNLIDGDARRRGVAAAVTGRSFSLAIDWSIDGPQIGLVRGRINPIHTMTMIESPALDPDGVCFSDDLVVMGLQAATHWDGLAHVSYRGRLYNGFPATSVTPHGATKLGIHQVGALASRGVLLDVARARGVERLAGGDPVTADDLDAACELARTDVLPGDVVLLRTGHIGLLSQIPPDREGYGVRTPGPDPSAAQWFRAHDVAAVATDTYAFEVFPPDDFAIALAVHYLHIVEMGLTQGQNWYLEDLAAVCADDGRYTCLLVAAPEPVRCGTGAPVHPVAIR